MGEVQNPAPTQVIPTAPLEEFVNGGHTVLYPDPNTLRQPDSYTDPHTRQAALYPDLDSLGKTQRPLANNQFDPQHIALDPSLNLVSAASHLLEFLQRVDRHPELFHGPIIDNAIQRYEKYWLPLAAKFPGHCLTAPLDIDWVWCCHLLCPTEYRKDCVALVGTVVDHRIVSQKEREQLLLESGGLWSNEFPAIPFIIDKTLDVSPDPHFKSRFSYDIASAVARQKLFFYQVSLPHYRDDQFLESCVLRYKKFLHLKLSCPKQFLVPCYDMDLIWHTHQLHPLIYYQDTTKLFGHLFPHDDTVTDRTRGSRLYTATNRTKVVWKRTFNERYSAFGCMYRGEGSRDRLYQVTKKNILQFGTKKTSVMLRSLKMSGLPSEVRHFKLRVWYKTGYQNFGRALSVDDTIIKLCGNRKKFCAEQKVMCEFDFNTKYNDRMYCHLSGKYGAFCFSAMEKLGQGCCKLNEIIENLDGGDDADVSTTVIVEFGDDMMAHCCLSVTPPRAGVCIFRLELGHFEDCVMPEHVEQMWGPITLRKLPAGVDNSCSTASHKLLNHMKAVTFTCRIIHSLPLLMSAVQVFYHDKMAVLAHLIGPEQLPLPTQVGNPKACVTFTPKKGERAILIKNHGGDWGVLLGRWTGVRRPVRRVKATSIRKGRRGVPGCAGYLEVSFYKMRTHAWEKVTLEQAYASSMFSFNIDDAKVELDHGLIEIKEGSVDVAENIAVAFSVALLHVLCQPHPKGWKPGEPDNLETNRNMRGVAAENLALVVACGFMIATPCNFYLRSVLSGRGHDSGTKDTEGRPGLGGIGSDLHGDGGTKGWWGGREGEEDHQGVNNHAAELEAAAVTGGFGFGVGEDDDGHILTSRSEQEEEKANESEDKDGDLTYEEEDVHDHDDQDVSLSQDQLDLDDSVIHHDGFSHEEHSVDEQDTEDAQENHTEEHTYGDADNISEASSVNNEDIVHQSDNEFNDHDLDDGIEYENSLDHQDDGNESDAGFGLHDDDDNHEHDSDIPEHDGNDSDGVFGYQDQEGGLDHENEFDNELEDSFVHGETDLDAGFGYTQDDDNNAGLFGNDGDEEGFGYGNDDLNDGFGFETEDVNFGYEADDNAVGFGYDLDDGGFGFENDAYETSAVFGGAGNDNEGGAFDVGDVGGFCDGGGGNDDAGGVFSDDVGGGAFTSSGDGGGDGGGGVFSFAADQGDGGGDGGIKATDGTAKVKRPQSPFIETMAKTRAEIQHAYRERKKANEGEKYLKRERRKVHYIPSSQISEKERKKYEAIRDHITRVKIQYEAIQTLRDHITRVKIQYEAIQTFRDHITRVKIQYEAIQTLRDHITRVKIQYEAIRDHITRVKIQYEAIQTLRDHITRVKIQYEAIQTFRDHITRVKIQYEAIQTFRDHITRVKIQYEAIRDHITRVKIQYEAIRDHITRVKIQYEAIRDHITRVKIQYEAIQTFRDHITRVKIQYEAIRDHITRVKIQYEAIQTLRDHITRVKIQYEAIRDHITRVKIQYEAIRTLRDPITRVKIQYEAIRTLRDPITRVKIQYEAIQTLRDHITRVKIQYEAIQTLRDHITRVKIQYEAIRDHITRVKIQYEAIQTFRDHITRVKIQYEAIRDHITRVKIQYEAIRDHITRVKIQYEAIRDHITRVKIQYEAIQTLRDHITRVKIQYEAIHKLRDHITRVKIQYEAIQTFRDHITRVKIQYEAIRDHITRVKIQYEAIHKLRDHITRVKIQYEAIQTLRDHITRVKIQYEAIRDHITRVKIQYEAIQTLRDHITRVKIQYEAIQTLRDHITRVKIQFEAIRTLKKISRSTTSYYKWILQKITVATPWKRSKVHILIRQVLQFIQLPAIIVEMMGLWNIRVLSPFQMF
ncbi:uncharacterized protein LOC121368951 [Gigantopelta aegis]|uniref:uncharacterized protein LOC121368951 n=1 Tax=Gigantopelta aegis TaxID=1735272 RepID=UPI001B88D29A|nr:uncharacterized protein LOC121368951 [Gigantopelta aegis]